MVTLTTFLTEQYEIPSYVSEVFFVANNNNNTICASPDMLSCKQFLSAAFMLWITSRAKYLINTIKC
jgi:hypothetical protein